MSNQKISVFRKVCMVAGIGLVVAGAAVMILWQWGIGHSQQKMAGCVQTLRTLLPEPQGAVLESRSDNTMAVLSLDGTDYVGILEMPRFGSALPVGAQWGKLTRHPCQLDGSIYDGSMQVGGTTQKGQYDFYREISVGDSVYFTDMEGNRYGYTVTGMRYAQHADQTALQREEADLTLFVKNVYAFEYLIIFCNVM